MIKSFFVGAAALLLSGCMAMTGPISSYVSGYCDMPQESRNAYRETLAVATSPNRVQIVCAADNN